MDKKQYIPEEGDRVMIIASGQIGIIIWSYPLYHYPFSGMYRIHVACSDGTQHIGKYFAGEFKLLSPVSNIIDPNKIKKGDAVCCLDRHANFYVQQIIPSIDGINKSLLLRPLGRTFKPYPKKSAEAIKNTILCDIRYLRLTTNLSLFGA